MRWELPAHSVPTSTSWKEGGTQQAPLAAPERHDEGPPVGKLAPKGHMKGVARLIITWKVPYTAQKVQWPWYYMSPALTKRRVPWPGLLLIKLAYSLL